ncbi:uncharacterized protein MEPE_05676 [Melanopsichium pennsylvanicum]|uniref:DUF833-domain-containing protein n=1 Tax=Melanopsichium pennsylvanicum TaxID=63383 RepID=A0AAJ4XSD3_9BASI|nr:uncharacterized protein MEPE_05676 [Melanopsichium pennsylvanicum]
MCVIFWTTTDPHYDLVIASNRDEFVSRPTLPACWHDFSSASKSCSSSNNSTSESWVSSSKGVKTDEYRILSARDATGGGTWLGVTRNGSFATLTNFTENAPPCALPPGLDAYESRGALVRDWLISQSKQKKHGGVQQVKAQVEEYLKQVGKKGEIYPGFNLLVGSISSFKGEGSVVGYVTNRNGDGSLAKDSVPQIFLPNNIKSKKNEDNRDKEEHLGFVSNKTASNPTLPPKPSRVAETSEPVAGAGAEEKVFVPGGMSNSILSEPWFKVTSGTQTFLDVLSSYSHNQTHFTDDTPSTSSLSCSKIEQELVEKLFDVLWTCSNPAPTKRFELRNSVLIRPLQFNLMEQGEKKLADWYATRTSTVILIRKDGKATLVERDTFQQRNNANGNKVVLMNGPEESGAKRGRNGGQRVYTWNLE